MDLSNLVRKYEKTLILKDNTTDGKYVNGRWVEALPIEKLFKGTILPLTAEELKVYEAGTYTIQDMKLFVVSELKDLNNLDLELKEGEIVNYNSVEYEIDKYLGAELVGFKKYIIKMVMKND